MIKKVFLYLFFVLFFVYSLIAFLPKENLYYLLESKLNEFGVVISQEELNDNYLNFTIENGFIFFNGIRFASFSNIETDTYLFTNKINVSNVNITDDFRNYIPQKIDYINIDYSVIDPLNIPINSSGEFGELVGNIDLINRIIKLELTPSQILQQRSRDLLRFMKNIKGVYIYEYKF